MFCQNCGTHLAQSDRFCAECGAAVPSSSESAFGINQIPETAAEPHDTQAGHDSVEYQPEQPAGQSGTVPAFSDQVYQPSVYPETDLFPAPPVSSPVNPQLQTYTPQFAPVPPVKKNKTRTVIIISSICAAVLIIAAVFAVPAIINAGKSSKYENAVALMEQGEYEDAISVFADLPGYLDSEQLAEECRNILDYNAAKKLMDAGKFKEAKPAFEALGSYKDSKAKAVECQNALDYDSASSLLVSGDFEQALVIFKKLGSYKESDLLAAECENEIDYGAAVGLMDSGDYSGARSVFERLSELGFSDSSELYEECGNFIEYNKAVEEYNNGRYYSAYLIFSLLDDFKDSAGMAKNCIQDYPPTGETYRNGDFTGTQTTLTVETPKDDIRPTFLKVYTGDETHVASMFIRGGDALLITLPPGVYMVKAAYGSNWFGFDDMFGDDDAYYQTLILGDGYTYEFRANYDYTLTLRDANDGNVGTHNENRGSF